MIDEKRRIQHKIVEQITAVATNSSELKTSEIIRTLSMSAAEEYRSGQKNVIVHLLRHDREFRLHAEREILLDDNNKIMSILAKDQLVPNSRTRR